LWCEDSREIAKRKLGIIPLKSQEERERERKHSRREDESEILGKSERRFIVEREKEHRWL
jgi:hypothetical protein